MIELPVLHGSAAESFAYWGTREGWLIALSQHRDSDAVDRSNWYIITGQMLTDYPDDTAIESMSNWAVGWVEHLLVRPGTPAADAAVKWQERLANYPVADEEHYGMLEFDEEWCVRCDRGTREQHREDRLNGSSRFTCHKFRSESDADEISYTWRHRRDK